MNSGGIQLRQVYLSSPRERIQVEDFLKARDLFLEKDVDYTVGLYDGDKIVGTGSLSGRVLKCIAVDSNYQGQGLSNKMITHLINEEYYRGNTHLFVFTRPCNVNIFKDMGFNEIATIDKEVVLLENDPQGLKSYLKKISKNKVEGKIISSIVMNCNPFTLGHRYLIEKAAENSDVVHVFIVWEDKSLFPSNVRLRLVKEGTKDLSNVVIHKGEDYIISNSTFPSYFLMESSDIVRVHASLDLKIFGTFIAPTLGINRRYIGEEPYSIVTRQYNETMKDILPEYDIEVMEIPRLEKNEIAISASRVRKLIKSNDFDSLKDLVPSSTYEFLQSEEGKPIIEKIINSD